MSLIKYYLNIFNYFIKNEYNYNNSNFSFLNDDYNYYLESGLFYIFFFKTPIEDIEVGSFYNRLIEIDKKNII
jgi:hypothetical protein